MATMEAPTKMFGQALKRREDPRLITGKGNYVDDIKLPGMLHAAILRSPGMPCATSGPMEMQVAPGKP